MAPMTAITITIAVVIDRLAIAVPYGIFQDRHASLNYAAILQPLRTLPPWTAAMAEDEIREGVSLCCPIKLNAQGVSGQAFIFLNRFPVLCLAISAGRGCRDGLRPTTRPRDGSQR
jgi:hypothetical protein